MARPLSLSVASLSLAAVTALLTLALPDPAEAQCWGSRCRRGVVIRTPRVHVEVGRRYYYPPPPTVVYQPPPVVYQPAPPPTVIVVQTAPVAEAPPPPAYEAPPPTAYEPPPETLAIPETPARPARRVGVVGIHGALMGAVAEDVAMGGFAAGLRLRPSEYFAFDFSLGGFGGEDYHGHERVELPANIDLLAFVNPQRPLQFYVTVGGGGSAAFLRADGGRGDFAHAFSYLGARAGLGFEWRLAPHFAMNIDGRAFLRHRVGSSEPEFVDGDRSTNLSGGFLGSLGLTLYL